MMLPIAHLVASRPRPDRVLFFRALIRAGIKPSPLRVRRVGERRWTVHEGAHRFHAFCDEGAEYVECELLSQQPR